ncbi:Uncharacterised protein [Yersinia aldovae]|uniref:Uncharacterized protein n=1 Tax=Yersinia aldovae TaxID=29483 RepID=A0A0T9UPW1_YERAL|nr:Uncharacterised protein [Yersinia aldovae]CNL53208.1 Uncharacterised protein [Yersinia aldovae]CNL59285.1 Uncharacterised protein [Yersinia aldovae]
MTESISAQTMNYLLSVRFRSVGPQTPKHDKEAPAALSS